LLAFLAALAIILSFGGPAFALDDGARAYWNAKEGTEVVGFQYLNLDIDASDAVQLDPGMYIYPSSDIEARISMASWSRHISLFKRASSLSFFLAGGDIGADVGAVLPAEFLPPGETLGTAFSQSSSGFADPGVQLVVNLYGTPQMKNNVDLLNYEPGWTLDAAMMLGIPIGEYDSDKLVNMGLNRYFGRVAFPIKYHFGVFDPGHMSSFELIPSVWLFAENDDFVGQKLENDPLYQLESHLTHDFNIGFFGSLDALYRSGFQSEIDGVEQGDELEIGNLGFTLNYQVTRNVTIRTGFSSNVFGDDDLNTSIGRLMFVYGYNPADENIYRVQGGH
jgi:hypothetical protein